ncbi:hypothetical protein BO83DRAFT_220907 [Aspergillus eucalypticola CBS 122712]|uniref:Uncharacterized protein n=1 Tax=Aspergillus eucalypticola (strain CBS 122712 / IBT 29274) TaxID=1448314 RepID=A0A317VTC0_ASPEC|nr:uncharacterized protein BO83DRAFT_220907 [Aspergillus eucalypticola CBS 122712]PWY77604.1 hypothetical protein BO83DRAFT_220907 [Aspergillus eucalypticola CBS 122712]
MKSVVIRLLWIPVVVSPAICDGVYSMDAGELGKISSGVADRWLDIPELHYNASSIRRCPNRIGSSGIYTIERPLQSQ